MAAGPGGKEVGLCPFGECDKPSRSVGQPLCNTHYRQQLRGRELAPFREMRSSAEVIAELAMGLRTCCDCKLQLSVEDFYKSDSKGRGLSSVCKKCDLSRRRKNRYGIATPEWEAMLRGQNDCCAICLTTNPGGVGWHTDHDHVLGHVRAILCTNCNLKLGHFEKWYLPNREAVDAYLNLTKVV